ncbi:phytoene/squalene synthetase [Palleronia aestuarii]|uniref:Phytoene/squalene synthetase n=1 Tax=Palleronia aestuarii TaxID=568105 RepID=A0A2W7NBM9_9RHOB|nr:squalene/phytoene synthase family protein [Palleronia aestuarii]PZX17548.1 phytoene/squalene synthetase [Palleronia aestuarii]
MSVNECAELVRRGDPDRFRSAMAAPPAARGVLFPLYAFNLEIARAPWMTQEPMIAEMRLQWWRDALDEIAAGKTPRRHEVVTPLAQVLDAEGAGILDCAVAARRWDIAREPFASDAQMRAYLEDSAGGLMWAAARALGARDEAAVRALGYAGGLAAWLVAVPALQARGVRPLVDPSEEAIRTLAADALDGIERVSRPARPAALAASEAAPILARAVAEPARVETGTLARSETRRRLRLIRLAISG